MKIQDMLSTETGVLLVSKVEELVGNVESNCRSKRKGKKRFRLLHLITVHDRRKRRHVSNSDLSRQQGMAKRERHVVNRKVPQHTPFLFFWVSSKILVFAESF